MSSILTVFIIEILYTLGLVNLLALIYFTCGLIPDTFIIFLYILFASKKLSVLNSIPLFLKEFLDINIPKSSAKTSSLSLISLDKISSLSFDE